METAGRTGIPLLERSEELARIGSALARIRDGQGGLVVVEGPTGIGKTSLLKAAGEVAAAEGVRVLRARGAQLEQEFAFGVVRQLFEPALADAPPAERADLLQGPAGVAAALLGLPGAPTGGETPAPGVDPSFAALHGLYWLVANLAAARPLCLLVDDTQWADVPSLRFLAFLLTRLEELDAVVLAASRPRDEGADAHLLATVIGDPTAELIRLAPLTRSGVGRFLAASLGSEPDESFVDACLRATRGTPFLVRELVEALREAGAPPTAGSAPRVDEIAAHTVGRSIVLRLRRLPDAAGRLAGALAVLERADLLDAARLAGLEPVEAAEAADVLTAAGLVDAGRPLAFVHPIVRSGIYSELSSRERSRAHAGAARILAEQPGANERVAEHLLATEPARDAWVVERLVEAARAASASGGPESAAVYLRRALAEPPSVDERSSLLLELGMAEASAGSPWWREHLQGAVDSAADETSGAAASMVLALGLSRAQLFGEAVEVLDRAAVRLGTTNDELRALLEAAAVGAGMLAPATSPALADRRRALRKRAAGDPSAPPELLAVAAFSAVLSNEPATVGVELALGALAAAEAQRGGRPWYSFATWFSQTTVSLLWAEEYARVRPLLDDSVAQARATGDSARLAVGLAHRAWVAFRTGDLRAAEGDARTALAAAALPAPSLYRVLNAGLLVASLTEQGALEAAEEVLAPMNADAEQESLTAAVLRSARGRLRVAQGRPAEGVADFLAIGALCSHVGVTSPSYLPWRSDAALAHLALGEPEWARALADEELELAARFGRPRVLGVALRAAGLVAGGDRGEMLLRDAVASFERAAVALERARALVDLGAGLRRRNRRSEAREFMREALDSAHRAGARPLAERAETELRATGARPRRVVLTGLESLTASERRIAELASQQLTNREIAQTLFVTSRTVEGHLTSVFRKLMLTSREELPAALADRAPTAG
jgi:DNA-binding CsgD family transcriptional regulator